MDACRRFADDELRSLVEPGYGMALALCYDGRLKRLLRKESGRVMWWLWFVAGVLYWFLRIISSDENNVL